MKSVLASCGLLGLMNSPSPIRGRAASVYASRVLCCFGLPFGLTPLGPYAALVRNLLIDIQIVLALPWSPLRTKAYSFSVVGAAPGVAATGLAASVGAAAPALAAFGVAAAFGVLAAFALAAPSVVAPALAAFGVLAAFWVLAAFALAAPSGASLSVEAPCGAARADAGAGGVSCGDTRDCLALESVADATGAPLFDWPGTGGGDAGRLRVGAVG